MDQKWQLLSIQSKYAWAACKGSICTLLQLCEIIGFVSATQQGSAFSKQTANSRGKFKCKTLCNKAILSWQVAANGWSLGYTFIGDPCESLLTVEKNTVRCPSLQAPAPGVSSLSKEAQEQQRNNEGGPAINMLALMKNFSGAVNPKWNVKSWNV